jgi:hypothetical protein
MIKNILDTDFKYENDKLYRYSTYYKKWICCNDLKLCGRYIQICINKKFYQLHRLIYKYHNEDWDITDTSNNNQIDHIDIDPTNNKIENLRVVNHSMNMRNKNKFKNCSSKYKGVSWDRNKWKAQIRINGKTKHLGYFDNEEEAYLAYKKVYDEIMDCINQK